MRAAGRRIVNEHLASRARVAPMATALVSTLVESAGREGFLQRVANPIWVQAVGALLAGEVEDGRVTLRTLGALRRGLDGAERDLGLAIHWGPARQDRPAQRGLAGACERVGRAPEPMLRIAGLAAKIDGAAMLDGYSLVLQAVVVSADGGWVIINQGRSDATGRPRRYHWLGRQAPRCADAPHAAIACDVRRPVVDLTSSSSEAARAAILELARMTPAIFAATAHEAAWSSGAGVGVAPASVAELQRRFSRFAPRTFDDVLLADGVGASEMEVLVGLAELLFGVAPSEDDPATHGFATGRPYREEAGLRFPRALLDVAEELTRATISAGVPSRQADEALRRLERHVEEALARSPDQGPERAHEQLSLDFD